MVKRLIVLGVAMSAFALPAASASAASDPATTLSYLRANYALVKVGRSNLQSSIAAYHGVLSNVRHNCPAAAANSPQNSQSTQLSNEVIGAMVLAAGGPDRPAVKAYLAATAGLHWSSASVTHAVSGYRAMLGALYRLPTPDVCSDIAKWAASGFTALPSSTTSFVKVFYPNWVALGLVPAGLSRFESGEARNLAHLAAGAEYQITNVEAVAVETWGQIMDELLLSP
jgi:hypothetical protein